MISIDELIAQERAVLDHYGKIRSGSELAEFVANRTRTYLVQEIEKAVSRAHTVEHAVAIVRSFRDF